MNPGASNTSHRRARWKSLLERALGGPPLVQDPLRRWVLTVITIAAACLAGVGFAVRNSSRPVLLDRRVDALLLRTSGLEHRVANDLSQFGDTKIVVPIVAVVAVVLILLGDYRAAVATVGSVSLAVVLVEEVFKPFFGRHLVGTSGTTFPSGLATVAFALASAVILAAHPDRPLGRQLGRALRYLLAVIVLILSSAVGVAMVVLEFHYMSDVIAGTLLGLAVTSCTALILDAVVARWTSYSGFPPSSRPRKARGAVSLPVSYSPPRGSRRHGASRQTGTEVNYDAASVPWRGSQQ